MSVLCARPRKAEHRRNEVTGTIEKTPIPVAEVGDVLMTVDGPRICVGRDLWERQEMSKMRIPTSGTTMGWTYHGTTWFWDKEKKRIVHTGTWGRYPASLIMNVRQLTPHPKTGEPSY